MSSRLKGGKKVVTTVVTTPESEVVTTPDQVISISEYDPNESVMLTTPWSFRLNRYQKDVITAAAEKMGISKQAYLRHTAIQYAMNDLGVL